METQKHEAEFNYNILSGDDVQDGEELRHLYARNTMRLIEAAKHQKPNYIIFLDKSARPVSWMVRELWDEFAEGEEMPEFKYLNIDREQWRDEIINPNDESVDVSRIEQSRINELRGLFVPDNIDDSNSGYVQSDIMDKPTILDNKRVMVVDEVKASGDTLRIAKAMLKKAFPDTVFDGRYWMSPESKSVAGGGTAIARLPVWYQEAVETGRGVGNRDYLKSRESKSKTQRIGRYFLSTRIEYPDKNSEDLRKEIKQMAKEYHEKNS